MYAPCHSLQMKLTFPEDVVNTWEHFLVLNIITVGKRRNIFSSVLLNSRPLRQIAKFN